MKHTADDVIRIRGNLVVKLKNGWLISASVNVASLKDLPEAVMLAVEEALIKERARKLKFGEGS